MATLHIRNVPDDVYGRLKNRAKREGTSLNHEALAALEEAARRERYDQAVERLVAGQLWKEWPAGAPTPEELIRRDRDER